MAQDNLISRQDISEDNQKIIRLSNCNGTILLIEGEYTENRLLMLTKCDVDKIPDKDTFKICNTQGSGLSHIIGKYIVSNKPIKPWKGWQPRHSNSDDWETAIWEATYYLS